MKREILINGKSFVYELNYKNVKNINIRIKPDGMVMVSANRMIPPERIDEILRKKETSIYEAMKKISETGYTAGEQNYKDGSDVYFLGEPLKLKLLYSSEDRFAERRDKELIVYADTSDPMIVREKVYEWYDSQLETIFEETGKKAFEKYREYIGECPKFSFRYMKSIWGSCSPSRKRISINKNLIKYDVSLIEFVFCHEFTHFIAEDHSDRFYRNLEDRLPDHAVRRELLKRESRRLGDC